MTLERGTLLHKRYRIMEILGQGGMGSIYRAVDENLGVEVAVKDNLFTTEEYARQFHLEAVLLASLRHPNLPRVTDHFVIGEQGQYLVMDYIEGEDLRQRMERTKTISEEESILIGAAMCDALQYLHTRKPSIVHRDVKPGNVKITPEGNIFLVDFGLAKLVRGSQATTTGARAMTPGYSPPEQYGTARTDPRTDIYSLGATLYASLCGVIPEDALARAMDNVELTPLRKHNPKISRRLAQVVEKAMEIRPQDRYQTAEEFKHGLLSAVARNQQADSGILADSTSQPTEQKKKKGEIPEERPLPINLLSPPDHLPATPVRHRKRSGFWVFLSVFLVFILIAVVATFYFWKPAFLPFPGRGTSTPHVAAEPSLDVLPTETTFSSVTGTSTSANLDVATQQPGVTPISPSNTPSSTPTISPSSTFTALPSSTPSPFSASSETVIPPLMGTNFPSPSVSLEPSAIHQGGGAGQIAFASVQWGIPQIFLMNSDGSDQEQITTLPDGACQPDWSPDGMKIVFISPCRDRRDTYPGSRLYVMNADGSQITSLPASDQGDFDPSWSPDGTRIAFTSLRDGYPQIYILNLGSDSATRLVTPEEIKEARQPAWSPAGDLIAYTVKRVGVLQVWVMTAHGTNQEQLIHSGSDVYDFLPAWSPDGQFIVFTQSRQLLTLGWLMKVDYFQGSIDAGSRITTFAIDGEFSPDGQWIVFEAFTDENYNIAIMAPDGTNRITLTTEASTDFDPAWRP